ncbi:hypothetical protein ED312_11610 [Sinomicrobium pectinilyticum]|uniref:Uncharacterized protein n=1 Tax=Sinomicrobium pectinilyticum TaxID=1084421 RepID=A0A3N0EF35_SINP1|nr:hypothetical protein ED312_11610 [Sinomicrobium pectinilyticum]
MIPGKRNSGKKKTIIHFVEQLQKNMWKLIRYVPVSWWKFSIDIMKSRRGFTDVGSSRTTVDRDLLHYRIAVRIPEYI